MNKVTIKTAFIAFCVSVCALFFAACAEDLDDGKNEKDFDIAGVWHFISQTNSIFKMEFKTDKTFELSGTVTGTPKSIKGNWSVKGSDVTTTITNSNGTAMPSAPETYAASKSGPDVILALKGGMNSYILSGISQGGTTITLKPGNGGVVEGEPAPLLSNNGRYLYRPIEGSSGVKLAGVIWNGTADTIFEDTQPSDEDYRLRLNLDNEIDGKRVLSIGNDFCVYDNSPGREALRWATSKKFHDAQAFFTQIKFPNYLTSIEPEAFRTQYFNTNRTRFSGISVVTTPAGLDFSMVKEKEYSYANGNGWFMNNNDNRSKSFIQAYNDAGRQAGTYSMNISSGIWSKN